MKILVACEMPPDTIAQLRSLASAVTYEPDASGSALRDLVEDVSILVVNSVRVSPETISRARKLQMIVRAGPGPGEIAIEEASTQGIFVCDCPDQHATAVAELAFGLMLALDRRIVDNTIALREGRWIRSEMTSSQGLAGRTLGILGYGPVGRLVAARARAFGLRVLAWSPTLTPGGHAEPDVEFCNWPRELARNSDFVTVHAVSGTEQETLVDEEFLQSMRPGACLVHVGHPGVADEAALAEAIRSQQIRVAVDLFAGAPAGDQTRVRCKICEIEGVIATQHIGPLTQQAHRAIADEVVRVVRAFAVTGEAVNCLNLAEHSPATWQLVLRVRDQVGVMASVLEAVRADGINAEEISSRVFTGAKAAWCTIALDERPSTEALEAIRALPDVLHLELRAVV